MGTIVWFNEVRRRRFFAGRGKLIVSRRTESDLENTQQIWPAKWMIVVDSASRRRRRRKMSRQFSRATVEGKKILSTNGVRCGASRVDRARGLSGGHTVQFA